MIFIATPLLLSSTPPSPFPLLSLSPSVVLFVLSVVVVVFLLLFCAVVSVSLWWSLGLCPSRRVLAVRVSCAFFWVRLLPFFLGRVACL